MTQAALEANNGDAGERADGELPDTEHHFVDFLDVANTKLIHALAATLHTEAQVEKYIEAEERRWDREPVLRILRQRKQRIIKSDE